jgi:hypothetical protein
LFSASALSGVKTSSAVAIALAALLFFAGVSRVFAQQGWQFHHLEIGSGQMDLRNVSLNGDRFIAGMKAAGKFDASRLDSGASATGMIPVAIFDIRFSAVNDKKPSIEWMFGLSNHRTEHSFTMQTPEGGSWTLRPTVQQVGFSLGRIKRYRGGKRVQFSAGFLGTLALPVAAKTNLEQLNTDTMSVSYRFFAHPSRSVQLAAHAGIQVKLTRRTGIGWQIHPGIYRSGIDGYSLRGRSGWNRITFSIYPR